MKFEEFWTRLHTLNDMSLETLSQKKEFHVTFDKKYGIVEIIPSTLKPRSITQEQFNTVWTISKHVTTPFKTTHYQDITRNSSYIVAMMKYLLNGEKIE
jgi:hypothetical protein